MVIIYDSVLTEPPSSIYCFRDVTLYTSIFLKSENLLQCPKGKRSMYWKWIKKYGAHDFIKEIILDTEEQDGIFVGRNKNVNFSVLNEYNMAEVINAIKSVF